ncbi:MAG: NosD domain-containing protein [Planctomycetota bacterium]|nr:NosD domain-containing protein [Planctomycetota bacterium]
MKLIVIPTLISVLASLARAQDAIVPDQFSTLQSAVFGATDVDLDGVVEILVRSGTYAENVLVQRSNLSISGAPGATIVGSGSIETIRVQNSVNVSISGLTVRNTGNEDGIEFARVGSVSVTNCVFTNCRDGLVMNRTQNSSASANQSFGNTGSGIKIGGGFGITLANNTCSSNQSHGIDLSGASTSTLTGNVVTANANNGLRVRDGSGNVVVGNTSSANLQSGLRIERTIGTLVTANAITNNLEWGVRLKDTVGTDFSILAGIQAATGDNTVTGNSNGALRND